MFIGPRRCRGRCRADRGPGRAHRLDQGLALVEGGSVVVAGSPASGAAPRSRRARAGLRASLPPPATVERGLQAFVDDPHGARDRLALGLDVAPLHRGARLRDRVGEALEQHRDELVRRSPRRRRSRRRRGGRRRRRTGRCSWTWRRARAWRCGVFEWAWLEYRYRPRRLETPQARNRPLSGRGAPRARAVAGAYLLELLALNAAICWVM